MSVERTTLHSEAYRITCQQCGRTWISTKPDIKACRFCKSYAWNEPKRGRKSSGHEERAKSEGESEWLTILQQDSRWPTKGDPAFTERIERKFAALNLTTEAMKCYEWLQGPKGQKKKQLRAVWLNWLENSVKANRNGTAPPLVTDRDAALRAEARAAGQKVD